VSKTPGWTGNGSAGFTGLGTPLPSPNPAARGVASGLHHPLALAVTLTRPFRQGGKESVWLKIALLRASSRQARITFLDEFLISGFIGISNMKRIILYGNENDYRPF